jgi:lysophospholipase L1-like esterase
MNKLLTLTCLFALLAGACVAEVGDGGEAMASDGEETDVAQSSAALGNGTYVFQSGVSSSRCMDVAGGSSADRTNIRNWTCNFSLAQKYRVESVSGGVRLVNVASNKCVDVDGNNLADLTNVQLYTCNGTGAQSFEIVTVAGGVNIVHSASGRCVGVADGSTAQAANIRIRTCSNGPAHLWLPRAAANPVRIMPLGASITQGFLGTHAGYRGPLHTMLDQARIPHRFVGSASDNPGQLPADQRQHEGHPGWVIADGNGDGGLRKHIDAWLAEGAADPDIALILVGSNDVLRGIDVPHAGARLDELIGRIRTLKPRVLIYVSTIPQVDAKPADTVSYNNQIKDLVKVREGRGEAVHLVDAYTPLLASGMKADGVHPSDAGYQRLAELWQSAIIGQ